MAGVVSKMGIRRGGLFAKYVASLVGLVVFVLAVNGAVEVWINYRETRASLDAAMAEKAEAVARRIEQSIAELERQISWVTRASVTTVEQRRADYAQLMNQQPAIAQLFQLDGSGREQLRLTRTTVTYGAAAVSNSTGTAFSKGADSCSGNTVAASATCTITINFAAPAGNVNRIGSLNVPDNGTGSPQTLRLTGS